MRKWLAVVSVVFVGALVLAPVAGAQEGSDEGATAPTPTQTIDAENGPPQVRRIEARHGVVPGPAVDRDDDPVFNDPRDPMQTYDRRSNTATSQVASPTGDGLTAGIGGSGGSVLAAAGRSGGSVSSLAQEARRSIKKLIRELDGD